MRDDFLTTTKEQLARRVAFKCSNPDCRRSTSGPHTLGSASVSIGVAAHITAASPGGPRFDSALASNERNAIENAIWLCQACAKLIDADPVRYTVPILTGWKENAESDARRQLESPFLTDAHQNDARKRQRRQLSKLTSYSTGFELKSAAPDRETLGKVGQLMNSNIASAYLEALDYNAPLGFIYLFLLRYTHTPPAVEVGVISHITPFVDSFADRLNAERGADTNLFSALPHFGDFKIRTRYQWVTNEMEYLPYKITGTQSTGILIECVDQPVTRFRFPMKTSDLLVVVSAMLTGKALMHDDLRLEDPLQAAFLEFVTSAQQNRSFSLESISVDHVNPENWVVSNGGLGWAG